MVQKMLLAMMIATGCAAHASDQPTAKGDPMKGKLVAEKICVACHMVDGNGIAATPTQPKLAGQIGDYLLKQLNNFKSIDGKPAVRNNPIMAGMAAPLTEGDVRDVSAWYSTQKQVPASPKDMNQIAAGQRIWRQGDLKKGIPACAGCHGPAGAGVPAQYPRLAGQFPEYLEAQLKAFRQGERANDPERMMQTIAAKMNDTEIRAVADYAAALR